MQGSFRSPAAATIRFIDDPGGAPTNSDFAIVKGDTWNSLDQLLSDINAVLAVDIGAGFSLSVVTSADTSGTIRVATGGNNFTILWSQSGDGSALRDWLGASADLTSEPDGESFPAVIPAAWYPNYAARIVRRGLTKRHRANSVALDGTVASQAHSNPSDADVVRLIITLWFGTAGSYLGHEHLESFIDAVFDSSGGGEPWSIFDDGDQWVCRWLSSPLTVTPTRVTGISNNAVWEVSFDAVGQVLPW